ncbi:CaiB/BaiF CoA transferase family protein [Dictyobacter formicarum]|uniref:CoA transferase n=1 Tax=Dictyobacter formicarum TaxID=2778368 RepID=A0ABQ3VBQ0_9CHLR|nr:CaiB/BaiF CoA-transferase family protein [Dictyobacter formicarum]GHO83220.1 CoA transferase [Dictyobacter formicarum]
MSQPLERIRVLDLSRLLPGPYASQMLADFGADVIKVEEPGRGDYAREMAPADERGLGVLFGAINRNKRSITLNLKVEQGCELLRALVRRTDIVIESFRPGVMQRLGLDYEQLKKINPDLIYCAISGYGQDGPYRDRAGHDLNYQGYAGLLDYQRDAQGVPSLPATQLGDLIGGSYSAVVGILLALVERAHSGRGCFVDVAMTENLLSLMPLVTSLYLHSGVSLSPERSPLNGALPCYHIYEAGDGKYVTLAALEPKFWRTFCERIGHPELIDAHMPTTAEQRDETIRALQAIFKTRSRDAWVEVCRGDDTCLGPVYSIDEAFNDPQARARHVVRTGEAGGKELSTLARFPRLVGGEHVTPQPVPRVGEHSEAILQELGYSAEQIQAWRRQGVI